MPVLTKQGDSRRLYQQVADQVRLLIQRGNYQPGSRLPPERDLAQQLKVSRPSLREALIALEIDGVVEIRMSSGVYVSVPPERPTRETSALGESPTDMMQARSILEGEVVMLACARATPASIAFLNDTLEAMRADIALGRWDLNHDRNFHVGLAEMAGNSVIVRLVGDIFDERHSPISEHLSERTETLQVWEAAVAEHEAIVQAIEARDPLSAQAAMRAHLKASLERWITAGSRNWV
jgi:GntR family transcriptional repressor for pyruvate dehydrogenase complex